MPDAEQPAASTPEAPGAPDGRGRVREVALLFARLGFTAFGGPAAHVALMEDQVVRRRRWLDRQHFLDLVAALNFIPGPNSTELAIHLGQLRAGWRGLVVAGACFITPAVLIVLPLAWAYVQYGRTPQVAGAMRGISAAVVAIILVAGLRFARTGLKDTLTVAVAVLAVPAQILLTRHTPLQAEIVVLAAAALAGVLWYARPALPRGAGLPMLSVAALPESAWQELARMAWFFLKVGGTLFGSGYVLVSYLKTGLVDHRPDWLTDRQLLDAVAVGQVTPGPLLTTATFVGYLLGQKWFGTVGGGVLGGVVATAAIFLPSFLLVAAFGRMLQRLRQNPHARAALDGMNAAVVAMILLVGVQLAMRFYTPTAAPDWLQLGIAGACLGLLLWRELDATYLIIAAGLIGWATGPA